MTTRVRVRDMDGNKGNCIQVAPSTKRPGLIFLGSPVRSLLDRDAAIELAAALVEHVDRLDAAEVSD